MADIFRVYRRIDRVDSTAVLFLGQDFMTRKSARLFCKQRSVMSDGQASLWIVHPDGAEEEFIQG